MIISSIRNIIRQTISSLPKLQARPGIATLVDDVGNNLIDDEGNNLISLIFGAGGEPEPPPVGGPWTPADLAVESITWLDATVGVTATGNSLDSWADQSSTGNTFNSVTYKPDTGTIVQNGLNIIDFSSNHFNILIGTITQSDVKCAMFVLKGNVGSITNSTIFPVFTEATSSQSHTFIYDGAYDISVDGSTSNSGNANVNGGSLISGGNIDLGLTASEKIDNFNVWYADYDNDVVLDSLGFLSSAFNSRSHFAEMVFLDYVPSESDRQLLEGYLAWKWGLEAKLPAGHPYKSAAPTT